MYSVRHDTQLNTREVRNAGRFAVEAYVLDAQDRVVAVTNAEGREDCPRLAHFYAYYGIDIACSCYTISVTWETMLNKRILVRRFTDVPMSTPSGFQVIKAESHLKFVGQVTGAGTQATSATIDYYSIFTDVYNLSDEYFNAPPSDFTPSDSNWYEQ